MAFVFSPFRFVLQVALQIVCSGTMHAAVDHAEGVTRAGATPTKRWAAESRKCGVAPARFGRSPTAELAFCGRPSLFLSVACTGSGCRPGCRMISRVLYLPSALSHPRLDLRRAERITNLRREMRSVCLGSSLKLVTGLSVGYWASPPSAVQKFETRSLKALLSSIPHDLLRYGQRRAVRRIPRFVHRARFENERLMPQGEFALGSTEARKTEDDCGKLFAGASSPNTPGTACSHNRVRTLARGRTQSRANAQKHARFRERSPLAGISGENSPYPTNLPTKTEYDRVLANYFLP